MPIPVRRVYEPVGDGDGRRILVDRLWPRGMRRDDPRIGTWLKDIAPSTDLRKWFGHDETKWPEFRKRYRAELDDIPEVVAQLAALIDAPGGATLVYASRETRFNHAQVLAEYLSKRHRRSS